MHARKRVIRLVNSERGTFVIGADNVLALPAEERKDTRARCAAALGLRVSDKPLLYMYDIPASVVAQLAMPTGFPIAHAPTPMVAFGLALSLPGVRRVPSCLPAVYL
ncbi:MAG: hypothetical protein BWY57_03360 [Betaproteobacteria bacterium ADurb.Bin341]|nr:MAG: hypothetical protein BWY57_03360 [Betaproteobacteria bacterium ADurb.Bin341]